jgi:quercetin dioxygenase-like cupin family protein
MTTFSGTAFVRSAQLDNSRAYLGHLISQLAKGPDTAGVLSLYEVMVRKGAEPPPHTHTREDEAFIVLDGNFRFLQGELWTPAPRGSFVWLPRGVRHSFEVDADGARCLVMTFPGGHLEGMFEPFATPATAMVLPQPPADAPWDEIMALDKRMGIIYDEEGSPAP